MHPAQLKEFLDKKVTQYNHPGFIQDDPILIPHSYQQQQDIEIAGFWAAIMDWGQRSVIISKCQELLGMMDRAPYDFILHHQSNDLKPLRNFKHRTFNTTDTLYFIHFLQYYYLRYNTLEEAFLQGMSPQKMALSTIAYFLVYKITQSVPESTLPRLSVKLLSNASTCF